MRQAVPLAFLILAACADWPDVGGPPLSRDNRPWPELMPLSEIIVGGTVAEAEGDDASRLAARAASLRFRAALLRRDLTTEAAREALRARLAR